MAKSRLDSLYFLRVIRDLAVHVLDECLYVVRSLTEFLSKRAGLSWCVLLVLRVLVVLGPESSEGRRPARVLVCSKPTERAPEASRRFVRIICTESAKGSRPSCTSRVVCVVCSVVSGICSSKATEASPRVLRAELESSVLILGAEAAAGRPCASPESEA